MFGLGRAGAMEGAMLRANIAVRSCLPMVLGFGACVLVAAAFNRPAAGGQAIILAAAPVLSGPLSSLSPSNFRVNVAVQADGRSTLQLFIEEYPVGSGCDGGVHHTNGGGEFQVRAGSSHSTFTIPWFGKRQGGYDAGYVRVGARLGDGRAAYSDSCFLFGATPRPAAPVRID